MVYKSLNGLALDYMRSMFTDRESVTSIQLRDSEGKLAVPMPRTNYLKIVLVMVVPCCGTVFQSGCGKHSALINFARDVEIFLNCNCFINTRPSWRAGISAHFLLVFSY